jgi:hypothetical protein
MFRQSYKTMCSQIKPDAELLTGTKNRILSNTKGKDPKIIKAIPIGALAACLVLVAVVAAVLKPGQPQPVNLAVTGGSGGASILSSAVEPERKIIPKEGGYQSVVHLPNGILNFIDSSVPSTSAKMFFDPKTTHEEEWTQEQVVKYLGRDVRPGYVPEVFLKEEQSEGTTNQFIIMNNDGTVAYDNIGYYYNGDPDDVSAPSLSVKVSKGKLPRDCVLYRSNNQTESNINGHKLAVGYEKIKTDPSDESSGLQDSYDLYFSEFIYDGIGYRVVSERLPQEEFVKVLQSIFK